ncbi:hypothetical protein TWF694_010100 [Orbilia ellipsospora]|uniref:Peptidase S8/S53 domain-containing protein n=1 Tax=Orbilia ellipsospora TaxID=2528407 RepID=A0AAV9X8X2_9PEZI
MQEADDAKILMFGAASDQDSASDICFPAGSKHCISIGAAKETGEMCTWVRGSQVEYTCPGYKIPFSKGNRSPVSYHSGNWVATAIASGLAGLILYCDILVNRKPDSKLQSREGISGAFSRMASISRDGKFLFVHRYFGVELPEINTWEFSEEKYEGETGMTRGISLSSLSPDAYRMLDWILDQLKSHNF